MFGGYPANLTPEERKRYDRSQDRLVIGILVFMLLMPFVVGFLSDWGR